MWSRRAEPDGGESSLKHERAPLSLQRPHDNKQQTPMASLQPSTDTDTDTEQNSCFQTDLVAVTLSYNKLAVGFSEFTRGAP